MPDFDSLLFANEAFYRAFADSSIEAMEQVWADTDNVACIHPGWGAIHGRDEVMASWTAILGNPDSPDVICRNAEPYLFGDTGFVTCYEELAGQYLIATNIFVRVGPVWRMVHHQAGPTSETPEADEEPDDSPMH